MKYIQLLFSFFCIPVLCLQAQPEQQLSQTEYVKDILTMEIEKMIEETGIPSISIALIKEEHVVWAEAFGYANVKTKTPATPLTVYSTGSTVKPFMSMAIMQLVEKGIVDLDEPVNNYLKTPIPSFPEKNEPITLRHLLSNQSGLPASADFVPIWGKDKRRTLAEVVANVKPIRAPAAQYEYSNYGFVIAALVIENQTQKRYGDYIKENILIPLQLENIDFTKPSPAMVEEMALPYKLRYNKAYPTEQLFSEIYPAGGVTYMTPSEMSRFLIVHLNDGLYAGNRLLDSSLMEQFHETSFGHEYYGLGIGIEKKNKYTYLFHSGQDAYSSTFKINLNLKTGVYLMANAVSGEQLNSLADLAIKLLDGEKDVLPLPSFAHKEYSKIEVAEHSLDRVVGSYAIEGTNIGLIILKRGKKLYLKNPINVEYELVPYAKDKFFLRTEEEQIEFMDSGNGIDSMVLYSNKAKIVAHKVK